MCMLDRRVALLLDEERYRRIERIAHQRGTSVSAVIREAIDHGLSAGDRRRRIAGERILAAEPTPVGPPDDLIGELHAIRDRRA